MKICAIVINLALVLNTLSAFPMEKCEDDGFACTNKKYMGEFQYTLKTISFSGMAFFYTKTEPLSNIGFTLQIWKI